MSKAGYVLAAGMLASAMAVAQEPAPVSDEEMQAAYQQHVEDILASVSPEHGIIALKGAPVSLDVPEDFDFYDSAESQTILEDLWGNPPDSTILGMLFPAGETAASSVWGAVLTYEATGYVSDEDAASQDYDALLASMQKQTREANPEYKRQGYPTVELVGWAVPPSYDAQSHGVSWAKDLVFDDSETHTLNNDMRLLGRRGVLSVNFVAPIDAVGEVKDVAPDVLDIPHFDPGSTYADYVDGDKKAGYGVAALIAGTTGAVVAKKLGLLGVGLLVLKKGWIIVLALLGGVGGWFKRTFGGGARD